MSLSCRGQETHTDAENGGSRGDLGTGTDMHTALHVLTGREEQWELLDSTRSSAQRPVPDLEGRNEGPGGKTEAGDMYTCGTQSLYSSYSSIKVYIH